MHPPGLLNLLSYRTKDHQLRGGTTHDRLGPSYQLLIKKGPMGLPTARSDRGTFFNMGFFLTDDSSWSQASSHSLSLVLWKPGLYIMLDKCSTMESLPFIRLYSLRDHTDLLGFLDGDHIFLHPQGLCFTCPGCLCQIPLLQIILISLTFRSETPMRLLPLFLKTSPQTSSGHVS